MVGDGNCASDNQAERSSDCTSSRVRWSEDGNVTVYCQKIRNSKSGLSDLVEGIR